MYGLSISAYSHLCLHELYYNIASVKHIVTSLLSKFPSKEDWCVIMSLLNVSSTVQYRVLKNNRNIRGNCSSSFLVDYTPMTCWIRLCRYTSMLGHWTTYCQAQCSFISSFFTLWMEMKVKTDTCKMSIIRLINISYMMLYFPDMILYMHLFLYLYKVLQISHWKWEDNHNALSPKKTNVNANSSDFKPHMGENHPT